MKEPPIPAAGRDRADRAGNRQPSLLVKNEYWIGSDPSARSAGRMTRFASRGTSGCIAALGRLARRAPQDAKRTLAPDAADHG